MKADASYRIQDQFGKRKEAGMSASFLVFCPLYLGSVCLAHIAQSVEHFLGKEEVTGSNPVVGSNSSSVCIEINQVRSEI